MSNLSTPSINLLTSRRHSYDKYLENSNKAKIYAVMALVVYLMMMVAAFMIDGMLGMQQEKLSSEENKLKLAIASQAANEQRLTAVAAKVESIIAIMNKRKTISEIFGKTLVMLPSGVKLENFDMGEEKIMISITAPHVVKAAMILDILEQNQQGYAVSKSDVILSRLPNAKYSLQVEMELSASNKGDNNVSETK